MVCISHPPQFRIGKPNILGAEIWSFGNWRHVVTTRADRFLFFWVCQSSAVLLNSGCFLLTLLNYLCIYIICIYFRLSTRPIFQDRTDANQTIDCGHSLVGEFTNQMISLSLYWKNCLFVCWKKGSYSNGTFNITFLIVIYIDKNTSDYVDIWYFDAFFPTKNSPIQITPYSKTLIDNILCYCLRKIQTCNACPKKLIPKTKLQTKSKPWICLSSFREISQPS